jgi:hypothetical protein
MESYPMEYHSLHPNWDSEFENFLNSFHQYVWREQEDEVKPSVTVQQFVTQADSK